MIRSDVRYNEMPRATRMAVFCLAAIMMLVGISRVDALVTDREGDVRVLMLIPHHWGANSILNLYNFRNMGWQLTAAGLTRTVEPCSWFKNSTGVGGFSVDFLVSEISDITQYDVLAIMSSSSQYGPNPYGDLLESPETIALVQSAVENGLVIWATCAGVRVLAAADVIEGRSVVGSKRFTAEYAAAGAIYLGDDHPPVIDGTIVTAVRGNYYNHHITQAIAMALEKKPRKQSSTPQHNETARLADLQWANTIWARSIGDEASICGRDICAIPGGGYALTGFTIRNGAPDVVLIRTDTDGQLIGMHTFGGAGSDYGNSICVAKDGGFIIAGVSTSFSADSNRELYVVKTTHEGAMVWQHTYGGSALDSATAICRVDSGGYAICGQTESIGAGEDDAYIIMVSENGERLWEKTFGGTRTDSATDINQDSLGHLVVSVACGSPEYSSDNMDHGLLLLDTAGNHLWWKTFNNETGEGFDYPNAAIGTADGGFLIAGSSDTSVPLDCMLIKTMSDGTRQWDRVEADVFHEYGMDILELNDGYIMAANIDAVDDWNSNGWLIRYDLQGNRLWERKMGDTYHDWISAMCRAEDGSVIVTGHTRSAGNDQREVFIAKIASDAPTEKQIHILMPADSFGPGDLFFLRTRIWNPDLQPMVDVPLFVILDVYGQYFFWPTWLMNVDYQPILLQSGASEQAIIADFQWPSGVGTADGIGIYAAMTTKDMTALMGNYDHVTFGWHP